MLHPLLYEINTRCWLRALTEQQRRPITLADVLDTEFDFWQQSGFSHIWLMGVWTTGPRSQAQALAHPDLRRLFAEAKPNWTDADVPGSPYAIADYHVSQVLGGDVGLETFRRKLQARGLKLLVDFVPNHLGLDHAWLQERPELFVQSASPAPGCFKQETSAGVRYLAYGKDPYFPPWTDTVQLDYRNEITRTTMLEVLQSIAERSDGVRCDMAMLLLNDVFAKTWQTLPASGAGPITEFWGEAIKAVKRQHPSFSFLAEAYWGTEPRLRELGFDYTYDKALYDKLISRDPAGVQRHLIHAPREQIDASAHFLENHDEPRIASLLSLTEHRAAALVILGTPGMRFLHEGQLSGAVRRLPVQLGCRTAEPVQPDIEKIYQQLLSMLARTTVGQGQAQILAPKPAWKGNPTSQNFVIIQWQAQAPGFDLVVVNLAPHRSQCYAPLSVASLGDHDWTMGDLLGTEHYARQGADLKRDGLYLDLPEHGAQLFHFDPV
jgi:hypothetical protein